MPWWRAVTQKCSRVVESRGGDCQVIVAAPLLGTSMGLGSGVMMLPKSSSTTATRRVPGVVWVRTTTVSPGWTQLVASWLSGSPPPPQAVSATPSARQATRAGSARHRGRAAPGAGRACGRSIPKCSVRRECQDKSPDSAMLESGHPRLGGTIESPGALALQDHPEGLQQNVEVEGQRPVLDVELVELQGLLRRHLATAVDLPPAGHAGRHLQARAEQLAVGGHLLRRQRPRADQAHLALEDVQQLWQLVEAEPAEVFPDRGHSRVVAELEERTADVHPAAAGRQLAHGAELVHPEVPTALGDPLLVEEHGARRREAD